MGAMKGLVSARREPCQGLVPVVLSLSQMFCSQADHSAQPVCNMHFWRFASHV